MGCTWHKLTHACMYTVMHILALATHTFRRGRESWRRVVNILTGCFKVEIELGWHWDMLRVVLKKLRSFAFCWYSKKLKVKWYNAFFTNLQLLIIICLLQAFLLVFQVNVLFFLQNNPLLSVLLPLPLEQTILHFRWIFPTPSLIVLSPPLQTSLGL